PTGLDEISGTAYPTGIELIGEPVAPNLLGLTVVVLCHHRIGLRREDERAGRIRLETHDSKLIVAAAEQDETGESEHTHRVDPPGNSKSLFLIARREASRTLLASDLPAGPPPCPGAGHGIGAPRFPPTTSGSRDTTRRSFAGRCRRFRGASSATRARSWWHPWRSAGHAPAG